MKVLEIDRKDLKYNLEKVKKIIKENGNKTKIIAVVKGNGMGLDLVKYSKFLVNNGITCLAVANLNEAIKLRNAKITEEILMLTPISDKKELQLLIKNDITLTVQNLNELQTIENILEDLKLKAKAHVKIDTGMGRYGFVYTNKNEILEFYKKCNLLNIEGIYTHFSQPKDEKWTNEQFNRFLDVIAFLKKNNIEPGILHCSASTAFLKYNYMHLNAVRLGSVFQGRTLVMKSEFRKIGKLKTSITEIKNLPKGYNISYGNNYKLKKQTKIAIIPVGYMDGLNLGKLRDDFSLKNNILAVLIEFKKIFKDNKLKVIINEKTYNIIGRIGMYHSIIDITESKDIKVGDEVFLNVHPLQTEEGIRREYK